MNFVFTLYIIGTIFLKNVVKGGGFSKGGFKPSAHCRYSFYRSGVIRDMVDSHKDEGNKHPLHNIKGHFICLAPRQI